MKIVNHVAQFRSPFLDRVAHRDVPENGVHNGREQLANHRRPDDPEEVKYLLLRKHCRRQQGQTVNPVLKPVSIVHRHSGPGIMPHDVPLVDMMFHSDSLDPLSKGFQLVPTTAIVGRPAEAR